MALERAASETASALEAAMLPAKLPAETAAGAPAAVLKRPPSLTSEPELLRGKRRAASRCKIRIELIRAAAIDC
jgi:hypothetical protein